MTGEHRAALGGIVGLASLVYIVERAALPAAWLPLEEAGTMMSARGHGGASAAVSVLFPLLVRPFAHASTAPGAYGAAHVLAAVLCALVALPAFALARRFVDDGVALVVAVLTVVSPAMIYATAGVADSLALLFAVWAFERYLRGDARALAWSLVLASAAALARPWFVVLPAILLLVDGRFTRWPRSIVFAGWAVAAYLVLAWSAPQIGPAFSHPWTLLRAAFAALAVAALAAGVVPWLFAFGNRLLAVSVPLLALAAGAFGAAEGRHVDERPLTAAVPLALAAGFAAWGRRPRFELLVVVVVVVVLGALALPALLHAPAAHAAGLGIAAVDARSKAVVLVLVAAILAGAVVLTRATATVALAAVGAFLVAGQAAAWAGAHAEARDLARTEQRGWVDEHVPPGSGVAVVAAPGATDATRLAQLELWNKTVVGMHVLDPASVDAASGTFPSLPLTSPYIVEQGLDLGGDTLATSDVGVLLRAQLPLSLGESVQGLYADGWSGSVATYRRFAGAPHPASVHVVVSRTAWGGKDKPGKLTIATGPLNGTTTPKVNDVIHAAQQREFDVAVPQPPFQVVVTILPTFSPAELGGGTDTRQLGAQIRFKYVP